MKEKELNDNSENDSLKASEQTPENEIAADNKIKTETTDPSQEETPALPKGNATKKKPLKKPEVLVSETTELKEEAVTADALEKTEEIVLKEKNKSKSKKKKIKMKDKDAKDKEKAKKKKQVAKKKEKAKEDKKKEKAKKAKQKAKAKKKAKAQKAKDKAKAKKIAKKKAKRSKSKSKKKK